MSHLTVDTSLGELFFKTVMQQSKQLAKKEMHLDEHGIKIHELGEAMQSLEDCVLSLFGVPEDDTVEKMILLENGDVSFPSDCFCRDKVYGILWHYTSGEIEIDDCFEKFKIYLDALARQHLVESSRE